MGKHLTHTRVQNRTDLFPSVSPRVSFRPLVWIPQPHRHIVFPGGFLPTATLLLQGLQSGSKGRLIVDSVSNIGPHYARTLREWRQRFSDKFDSVIRPALRNQYPNVMGKGCPNTEKAEEEIEVFRRKWMCRLPSFRWSGTELRYGRLLLLLRSRLYHQDPWRCVFRLASLCKWDAKIHRSYCYVCTRGV